MLGVTRWMLVREVLVPGAVPMVFTGLRLSLQACWTTLVAGELIGAIAGLGRVLYAGRRSTSFPAMILVGMVGGRGRRRAHDRGARVARGAGDAVARV